MRVIFRRYGERRGPAPLEYIKQIPEVSGVMGTLSYKVAGALQEEPKIKDLADSVHATGLECEVIESVDMHEDIRLGLPTHDRYIDAYNKTLENLAKYDVKVVVHNFTPVLDWLYTNLAYETENGSGCLCYNHREIEDMDPRDVVELTAREPGGLVLPGWGSEYLAGLNQVMGLYQGVDCDAIRANYQYFLESIIPTARKAGIKMVCRLGNPVWDLFGLPRIHRNRNSMNKTVGLYDFDNHSFCIRARSFDSNMGNDIPAVMREFGEYGRLHAAHTRNVKRIEPKLFHESPHPSSCGDLDMYAIMEAIRETGPNTYIHPDHRRTIWSETKHPGCPLYDRASGAVYLAGLRGIIEETHKGEW